MSYIHVKSQNNVYFDGKYQNNVYLDINPEKKIHGGVPLYINMVYWWHIIY